MSELDKETLASVCRRVKKLLAIAEDGRGTVEEAGAAAAMAARIMAKYRLDNQDLLISELRLDGAFGDEVRVSPTIGGREGKASRRWFGMLAVAVVRANQCHCEWIGERTLKIYGVKSDVEVAGWMLDYLANQANVIAKAYYVLTKSKTQAEDFRQGIVDTLIKALKGEASETGALVVTKNEAIRAHFGKIMTTVSTKLRSSADRSLGNKAGASIDLGRRGVGGTVSGTIRLN